jgi:hypothetical protein
MVNEISKDFLLTNLEMILWASKVMDKLVRGHLDLKQVLLGEAYSTKHLLNKEQLVLVTSHLNFFKKDQGFTVKL